MIYNEEGKTKRQIEAHKWYERNKELSKARAKAQYWADPEGNKKRATEYSKTHKEQVAKNSKARREKAKQEDFEAYQKRMRENNARYRAKIKKEKGLPEINPNNPNPKPVHIRMTEEERQLSILARLESIREIVKMLRT